jgi:hypothetical protein
MPDTALTVSPEVEQGVKALDTYAKSLVITTVEQAEEAGDNLAKISYLKKAVEDQRTEITRPLNVSLRSINAFFKKFSEPLESIDEQVRAKVAEFGKTAGQTNFGMIHMRSNEVVVVDDESLVPREYMQVNMTRVKADIKAGRTIPGIKVVVEQSVSL